MCAGCWQPEWSKLKDIEAVKAGWCIQPQQLWGAPLHAHYLQDQRLRGVAQKDSQLLFVSEAHKPAGQVSRHDALQPGKAGHAEAL